MLKLMGIFAYSATTAGLYMFILCIRLVGGLAVTNGGLLPGRPRLFAILAVMAILGGNIGLLFRKLSVRTVVFGALLGGLLFIIGIVRVSPFIAGVWAAVFVTNSVKGACAAQGFWGKAEVDLDARLRLEHTFAVLLLIEIVLVIAVTK